MVYGRMGKFINTVGSGTTLVPSLGTGIIGTNRVSLEPLESRIIHRTMIYDRYYDVYNILFSLGGMFLSVSAHGFGPLSL